MKIFITSIKYPLKRKDRKNVVFLNIYTSYDISKSRYIDRHMFNALIYVNAPGYHPPENHPRLMYSIKIANANFKYHF